MMVVVRVMGIPLSTALLTYLGSRRRTQNRAAQSNLRNAIAAADTFFTDGDTHTGFAAAAVLIEPSLTWVDGAAGTAVDTVYIHAATTGNVAVLNAYSASGTAFCIAKDVGTGGGQNQGNLAATWYATCADTW